MTEKNKRSKEYSKLLTKKEWKEKRLEILTRDDFTCQDCLRKDLGGKNLQVHHNYYISGKLPWEYEDDAYTTLCQHCHLKEHNMVTWKYDIEKDYGEYLERIKKKPIKILEVKQKDIKKPKKKNKKKKNKKTQQLSYAQKKAMKYVKNMKLSSEDKRIQKKYDDLNNKK